MSAAKLVRSSFFSIIAVYVVEYGSLLLNIMLSFQEIIDRLPDGETKFTIHQNKCEAILAKYSKEDTQKFRADQEAIQMRWSQLVSGYESVL